MSAKTNAARILDQHNVPYESLTYPVDKNNAGAIAVAEKLGIDASEIYKTLVLKTSHQEYIVAVIPGDKELNLKKTASACGVKNCELIAEKDLQKITGYIRGGCSPIGMKKKYNTYIDKSALSKGTFIISAGKRGNQFRLNPQDLSKFLSVYFVALI